MSTNTQPKPGTRKRLAHIDAMRPVKQAAVISTHTLVFFAPLATSSAVVGLIMLTRFSRDAFLFVSACMLAYSYKNTETFKFGHYFKRRFMSVGLPYIAWTIIYFFYTSLIPVKHFPFYSFTQAKVFSVDGWHYFSHLFLTGYYHLYYLIVIMEFYVLFPFFLMFVRKFSKWHWAIMGIALLWQLAYGALLDSHHLFIHLSGTEQTRLITSYPIYLVGGVIVALHLDEIHDWIVAHGRLIVTLTVVFAIGAEVLSYLDRYSWLPYYLRTGTYVYSPTIVPFNIGAILCVYLLGVHLVSAKRSERTRAAVRSGSDNSYGVYLSQMLWIPFLLRVRNHFHLHLAWGIAVPLALLLVYSLGFLFTAIVARTPLALAVTGRSRATWESFWPRRHQPAEELQGDTGDGPFDVVYE
jgi:peptidoglycan/LPS O-acetylase OafA/YrhL